MPNPVQSSPLTVTPSGQEKSVTVSKCHSNRVIFYIRITNGAELSKLSLYNWGVTVTSVTVSGEVCTVIIGYAVWEWQTPQGSHANLQLVTMCICFSHIRFLLYFLLVTSLHSKNKPEEKQRAPQRLLLING